MNKYFLKQQLARVPFIGSRAGIRYAVYEALPRSYLLRQHPDRRGKDVETTRRKVSSVSHHHR